MKAIKEIKKEVETVHDSLKSKGIHQFTIDLVELVHGEIFMLETGECPLSDETILGSIAYKIDTVLEIAREDSEDYLIYKRLQEIIEKGRKS